MSHRLAAVAFVEAFCAGRVDQLEPLLTPDFQLDGPLLHVASREAYLSALVDDPPEPGPCTVLKVFEDGPDVCVLYDRLRPDGPFRIAQWTRGHGEQIAEMKLIFDASSLSDA